MGNNQPARKTPNGTNKKIPRKTPPDKPQNEPNKTRRGGNNPDNAKTFKTAKNPPKKPIRKPNVKTPVRTADNQEGLPQSPPLQLPRDFERRNRIKEVKKNRRQMVCAVMVVFLTFYSVISLVIVLYYYISFNSTPSETVLYSVSMVNQKGKTVAAASVSQSNKAYGLYVSLTDLDTLCSLSVAGDGEKLTIMLRKSGEILECFTNSSFMYVNGNPARLSIPILYENYEYYLPVELLEQYFIGVDIKYIKGKCVMSLAEGTDTVLELKLKSQPVLESLTENTGSQ